MKANFAAKLPVLAKLCVLAALAVATNVATNAVLARSGPKKSTVVPQSASKSRTNRARVAEVGSPKLPPVKPRGLTAIDDLRVEATPAGIHIVGQGTVRDFRPTGAFVWSVRVRDAVSREVLAEQRYDSQVFHVPADAGDTHPTFEDVLKPDVHPGNYKLELALYDVPRRGIGLLNDPDLAKQMLMAKKTVDITVAP